MIKIIVLILLSVTALFAQEKSRRWAILPVVASSAETGLQLGAFGAYFPTPGNNRPSSLNTALIASFKGQYQAIFSPDLYLSGNRYHIEGFLIVRKWPANHYGIGNDTPDMPAEYDARGTELLFTPQRRFKKNIFIGPYYHLAWEDVDIRNPSAFAGLAGARGGRASGLGVWAVYDTRDNPNAPRTGHFFRYTGIVYRTLTGSDFPYQVQTFELRTYLPSGDAGTLALSSYLRQATGTVPFRELSTPDGTFTFRGIEKGRYRDRYVLTLQSEYRLDLPHNFGLTTFAELAQVSPDLGTLGLNRFKTSFGLGLRYAINPEQRFNLRVDTSWTDGTFGLTVNAREAF